MAHGFLQSFDSHQEVYSAGTSPAEHVHPLAISVMAEVGIDISHHVPRNVKEYLANPKIIACGGSWMVKENLIKEGKFDEITRLTAEAMALVRE